MLYMLLMVSTDGKVMRYQAASTLPGPVQEFCIRLTERIASERKFPDLIDMNAV